MTPAARVLQAMALLREAIPVIERGAEGRATYAAGIADFHDIAHRDEQEIVAAVEEAPLAALALTGALFEILVALPEIAGDASLRARFLATLDDLEDGMGPDEEDEQTGACA